MGNKLSRLNISGLNTAERLQFFINTGFYFSMQIRGKYSLHDLHAQHEDREYRAINECFHRIFQCLRGIGDSHEPRMPDDTVVLMLNDIAKEANLQEELNWAIEEATKLLAKSDI